jgi:hypothetical protein
MTQFPCITIFAPFSFFTGFIVPLGNINVQSSRLRFALLPLENKHGASLLAKQFESIISLSLQLPSA